MRAEDREQLTEYLIREARREYVEGRIEVEELEWRVAAALEAPGEAFSSTVRALAA